MKDLKEIDNVQINDMDSINSNYSVNSEHSVNSNHSLPELLSEDVQEVMSKVPNWLTRWGIILFFAIIALLLIGSCIIKYPDIIEAPVVITTENPPAILVANVQGRITNIYVTDKQLVKPNQLIATIESTVSIKQLYRLKKILEHHSEIVKSSDSPPTSSDLQNIDSLGELQSRYAEYKKALSDIETFNKLEYHKKKINSLKQQIEKYNILLSNYQRQKTLSYREYQIGKRQFERDSVLFKQKVIAEADFEKAENQFLNIKHSYENILNTITNQQLQINNTEQAILDLQLQYEEQKNKLILVRIEAFDNLVNQISAWEKNYIIKSPIEGKISFSKYWSTNQVVKAGENIFNIVSETSSRIIARTALPIQGSGKVKEGQRVNIKLQNFPSNEYGVLRGIIKSLALVPTENTISVEICLPDSLTTSYKKQLPYYQEMQGSAEIITEDLLLIERFIQPIRAMLKNQ